LCGGSSARSDAANDLLIHERRRSHLAVQEATRPEAGRTRDSFRFSSIYLFFLEQSKHKDRSFISSLGKSRENFKCRSVFLSWPPMNPSASHERRTFPDLITPCLLAK
jgi:hypothetical protein